VESRRTILVVEDDDDFRESFAGLLGENGYEVVEARDGREALRYLDSNPAPRVIFLDLMMPGMDGIAFLDERRRDPRMAGIPVFVFSARNEIPWTLDVARIFRKPLDRRSVLNALGTLDG
jgi:CheY-like chemotaxis protein